VVTTATQDAPGRSAGRRRSRLAARGPDLGVGTPALDVRTDRSRAGWPICARFRLSRGPVRT